ncbi:MAG: glutaredoxin family protein [Candidatus Omnitrophota bacterium]
MSKLTLYYQNSCPYCRKVLNFMDADNIHLTMKNVHEKIEHRQELINKGGKSQVPALEIDGKIMYESNDIIEWLKKNYKHDS